MSSSCRALNKCFKVLQSSGYTALVLVGSCHGRICIYRAADPALLPACLPTLTISQDFGDKGEHLTSYILSPHSLRGQNHHGWECCCWVVTAKELVFNENTYLLYHFSLEHFLMIINCFRLSRLSIVIQVMWVRFIVYLYCWRCWITVLDTIVSGYHAVSEVREREYSSCCWLVTSCEEKDVLQMKEPSSAR